MYRILNDDGVIEFLQSQNNDAEPTIYTMQLQVHIDYNCGCKIAQDKKGNWVFPCYKHNIQIAQINKPV